MVLVFCMLILVVSSAQASIQSAILESIVEESPSVWGIDGSSSGDGLRFVPDRGGIKVCKAEKKIIVGFYLSDDDIEFYNQTFSDGSRKPIGFEIEVVDYSGVFNRDNITGYEESFSQSVRYDDNAQLDDNSIYSVCINDPTKLESNKWHTVEIKFSDYNDVALATFAVQVQLVGDIRKLSEDYPSIYAEYSVIVKAELLGWWTVLGGHEDIDGNNFFNIRNPRIMFSREKFFGWPEGIETGYDRVFWRMGQEGERADYKPYFCGFGSDPWDESSGGDGDSNGDSNGGDVPPGEDPDNPGSGGNEPLPKPNLRIYSVTIEDPSGNDLSEQASYMSIGETYKVKVYPISEDENCENGVDSDTENVETDIYYKISHEDSDGQWVFLERVYTQPSTLTEGHAHQENAYFTVPGNAQGMRVYFKAIVDSTGEVSETNEDDNESYWQKEWYPVAGNTNLIVSSIYLVDGDYNLKLGDNFRIGMGVQNTGVDTPLVGFRSGYYVKRPNESNFTKWDEDGSDANELTPGTIQWEATPIGGYPTDQIGTWQVKVCADIYQDVQETNENDNCQTMDFTVSPIGPDLVVHDMYLKVGSNVYRAGSTVPEDSYVHPYCVVGNIGNSSSHPGFRLAYYINSNKYRDSDGLDANEVCVGCTKTEYVSSNSIRLGSTGTRSYRCCVDYQGAVSELNESNNCQTFSFYVR